MARKRNKQDVRASVAAAAGRLTFGQVGAALTEAQLDALAELVTVSNPLPPEYRQVALYVGQCQLDRESDAVSSEDSRRPPPAAEEQA